AIDQILAHPTTKFEVKNLSSTQALIQFDEVRRTRNERQIERIQNDFYLEEAYLIFMDLLQGS
ncbi:MAG: hypothetical protein AAF804_18825, partial [Bacteroidota bacterium]